MDVAACTPKISNMHMYVFSENQLEEPPSFPQRPIFLGQLVQRTG